MTQHLSAVSRCLRFTCSLVSSAFTNINTGGVINAIIIFILHAVSRWD